MAAQKKSSRLRCIIGYIFGSTEKLFKILQRPLGSGIVMKFTVRALLEIGADVDARDSTGNTPLLHAASHYRRKNIVELLIDYGANVNYCNIGKWKVLHYACYHGWTDLVQSLVKRVHDIDAKDLGGDTALHVASCFGELKIVKCLLEAGADMNVKNYGGTTPLLTAALFNRRDIFCLLLDAGAIVDSFGYLCYEYNFTVFQRTKQNCWTDLEQSLVKRLFNLDATNWDGMTVLNERTSCGDRELVKYLVDAGANINMKNHKGTSPLMYAAELGIKSVFDLLLSAGADVDSCDVDGCSVLHYASRGRSLETVQYLVKRLPDINKRDRYGKTALHHTRFMPTVRFLVKEGANCNIVDIWGNSPLHYVIESRRFNDSDIKFFIENGAVFLRTDYEKILSAYGRKTNLPQDAEFCCRVIVNNFNSLDLPELYKSPVAESLPRLEKMKIVRHSEQFQAIERTVRSVIQTTGCCNPFKECPMMLHVLCIKSILEYFGRKRT